MGLLKISPFVGCHVRARANFWLTRTSNTIIQRKLPVIARVTHFALAVAVLLQCAPGRICAVELSLFGSSCHANPAPEAAERDHDCSPESARGGNDDDDCACQIPKSQPQPASKQFPAEVLPVLPLDQPLEARELSLSNSHACRPLPVVPDPPDRTLPLLN